MYHLVGETDGTVDTSVECEDAAPGQGQLGPLLTAPEGSGSPGPPGETG